MTLSRLHLEYRWLIIVPLLLLAGMLAGRRLNTWTFGHDETSTVMAAGAREFGPRTPLEALNHQLDMVRDQSFGWVIVVNLWGQLAGWSTVAIRALPWLAGLLTLALVYRVGRNLFHHRAGLFATLLLATSVFFISYLHIARAFTFVALFATLVLWSYWRAALHPQAAGKRHWASLLLSASGLLYAHYFGALFFAALGLIHLLFVGKNRRWWQVSLLLLLVALFAVPQIESFMGGLEQNRHRYTYGSAALTSPAATTRLIYMFTNSLVDLPRLAGTAVVFIMALFLLYLLKRRPRHPLAFPPGWYPGMLSLLFAGLVLTANLFVPVLIINRMRYFMAVWPPVALLAGFGIWRLERSKQRLAEGLLIALVASALALHLRSDLYLSVDNFEQKYLHLADQALLQQARHDDFMLLEEETLGTGAQASPFVHLYYTTVWTWPREYISREALPEPLLQRIDNHARLWLLARDSDSPVELTIAAAFHFCRRPVNREGTVLTLYAQDEGNCT